MKLSARNQITGTVTSIVQGEASTVVHIDADGTKLVSSITTEAARDLGLAEGSEGHGDHQGERRARRRRLTGDSR